MTEPLSTVLITGGTGSLGQALTRFLLATTTCTIRILSRDELKQSQMRLTLGDDRIRYFLGDVRDLARLHTALAGVQCVWHTAALKRIDAGQYDPQEFVKTNVIGTLNVINACQTMGVMRAVLISTDKAVCPLNLYGATKLMAEACWTQANVETPHGTLYSTIRYGNVTGSRGSVVPTWRQALAEGRPLFITDPLMTRFYITLSEAVDLAWFAALHAPRGSILVPHLPTYTVRDLAYAVMAEAGEPPAPWKLIGIRPGEKRHEQLMTDEEARTVRVASLPCGTPRYYGIPPVAPSWPQDSWQDWKPAGLSQPYRSDVWGDRLSVADLRTRLQEVSPC